MSVLHIARWGHPALRQISESVPLDQIQGDEIQRLIRDMAETRQEYGGGGLAAVQIHVPLRIMHVGYQRYSPEDPRSMPLTVLFNPEWEFLSEEQELVAEGCLSIPGITGVVSRHVEVSVRGFNEHGALVTTQGARNRFSHVLQHEMDHLNGALFTDKADPKTLMFEDMYRKHGEHHGIQNLPHN